MKFINNIVPIVTVDGPSGSGKGALSKQLAYILGWNLLDSGMIYRILACEALDNNIDMCNEDSLQVMMSKIKVSFINIKNSFVVYCNDKEIKKNIHTEFVGNLASKIALFPKVRDVLLKYQRTFCVFPGLVADGRDMGTIVFPNAIVKIFLNAAVKVRAQRRLDQLQKVNFSVNFKCLSSQIKERDDRDCNRQLAPLVPAVDAFVLDSTHLSKNEVENKALLFIQKKIGIINY